MKDEVYRTIPHRPPFLFVDEIVSHEGGVLIARKYVKPDEPYFEGHYPGNPIMPGVLLCESAFQAGAILLVKQYELDIGKRTPVLTRIRDARFRNMVRPGDNLDIRVGLGERYGKFHFMNGSITTVEKKVLTVDFGLALIEEEE